MTRRMCFLLIVCAMFAAACGSSASEPETSVASSADGASSAPADDTAPAASDAESESESADEADAEEPSAVEQGETSMAASSPIGAFFSDDGGFEAAIAEYTIRVEEEIVRCMAEQGFEFKVSGAGPGQNEVQLAQNELTRREWTQEYGYGISTSFDSIAQSQGADPNTEIFLSMSVSEREIWVTTLTGGGLEAAGGDFDSIPLEDQGCVGQALIETGGQEAIEGLDEFGSVYEEGEEALFDRREMIEAVDAWSLCMSEAGYPGYAKVDDPNNAISEQFDEITGPLSDALDELSPEEGQALISGESLDIDKLPGLDVDALRDLQAEEIELALVDLDCYDLEVKAIYEPLRDEFEAGLLTEFASEFDALKNIGN